MQKNKNLLIALGAVIVVIILAVMLPRMDRTAPAEETPVEEEVVADTTTKTPAKTTVSGNGEAYDAMLASYEGKTITFGNSCSAGDQERLFSVGDKALLVNKADEAHKFAVGGTTYSIGSRHYKTISFSKAGTTTITCDGDKENIVTVTVK